MQDIDEAITNYISYIENNCAKTKYSKENLSIKQEYKVPDFTMQITEYKEMLEKLRDKNMFTQKSIDKCKKALDNVVLQEDCVKHIVKDIMFKIKARNKALAEARAELELNYKSEEIVC